MKKGGVLNAPLSKIIASMGHTDKIVVCDSGLPIPKNSDVVDLAVTSGIPKFIDVLQVILEELHVEKAVVAEELKNGESGLYEKINGLMNGTEIESVQHDEFKDIYRNEKDISFVRTGESIPFANIILVSGVTF